MERNTGFVTFYLYLRSPVFRAMLSANMKERQIGRIELTDLKLKTGQELLTYLYNGKLERGADQRELLVVADRYDLAELKETCADALKASISDENCLDLLLLGDMHHVPLLKSAALNHVRVHSKRMFQAPNWEEKIHGHASLLMEIINAMAK